MTDDDTRTVTDVAPTLRQMVQTVFDLEMSRHPDEVETRLARLIHDYEGLQRPEGCGWVFDSSITRNEIEVYLCPCRAYAKQLIEKGLA
jgi:hypothetical protein